MPRLCRAQSQFHTGQIAQLAQHQNIGIAPQNIGQSIVVAAKMRTQLTLVHQSLAMRKHIFNRVFNRDDMAGKLFAALCDPACQSGGFAATGRPRNQHQTTGKRRYLPQKLGHHDGFRYGSALRKQTQGQSLPLRRRVSRHTHACAQSRFIQSEMHLLVLRGLLLGFDGWRKGSGLCDIIRTGLR